MTNPYPEPMRRSAVSIKFVGVNGASFDVVQGTEGVVLTEGLGGVELPTFVLNEVRPARAPGRRVHGVQWRNNVLRAKFTVADTWANRPDGKFRTGPAWVNLDTLFREAFTPLKPARVEVSTDASIRTYRGRLDTIKDVTGGGPVRDIRGRADYDVELSADVPFWQGTPTVLDFPYDDTGTADNYYGPGNAGPPFVISRSNTTARTAVQNPGQVDAWPTWTVTGPARATVGVGGHLTDVTVGIGQRVTVATDPHALSVTDENGRRAWHALGVQDFAPVPAGRSSDVLARIVSGGAGANIRLELTPNYLSWQ